MLFKKNTVNKNILDNMQTNNDMNEFFLIEHDKPTQEKTNQEYFYNGLYYLYKNNLIDAKNYLLNASNNTDKVETLYWKSQSFLGLVEVLLYSSNGGLHRCYEAEKECSKLPEMYLNIAYAEYKLENRKRAVNALQHCLKLDPDNKQAHSFFKCIGKRSRKNLIKKIFGKLLRGNGENCCVANFNNQIQDYLSIKLDSYVKKMTHQT